MNPYFLNYPEDQVGESGQKKFEQFRYPAGEEQVRIKSEEIDKIVAADEIFLVARITSSAHVIGLALLSDALDKLNYSADRILVLPYLPYSRADRRFTEGDCFGLKMFGKLIDELAFNKVVTFDVHSSKANQYIANLHNVNPLDFIKRAYEACPRGTAILLPDEGAKRYGLENEFKNVLYCEKKRDPQTGKFLSFKLPPPEKLAGVKDILIVDDICDGGGTFLGIAELVKDPSVRLYLYVTHGIFSKGLGELSKVFDTIFTTDSFRQPESTSLITVPIEGYIRGKFLPIHEVWKEACQFSSKSQS